MIYGRDPRLDYVNTSSMNMNNHIEGETTNRIVLGPIELVGIIGQYRATHNRAYLIRISVTLRRNKWHYDSMSHSKKKKKTHTLDHFQNEIQHFCIFIWSNQQLDQINYA